MIKLARTNQYELIWTRFVVLSSTKNVLDYLIFSSNLMIMSPWLLFKYVNLVDLSHHFIDRPVLVVTILTVFKCLNRIILKFWISDQKTDSHTYIHTLAPPNSMFPPLSNYCCFFLSLPTPSFFFRLEKENQKRKTKSLKKLGAQMGHFQIVLAC